MIITYRAHAPRTGQPATYTPEMTGRDAVAALAFIERNTSLELVQVTLTPADADDEWAIGHAVAAAASAGIEMSLHHWVPTASVREGDQLAHKLSNTPWTYTPVTGWSDRVLAGCGAHDTDVTHRTFTVSGAPWWVRCDNMSCVSDLAGETLILRRDLLPEAA